MNTLIAKLKNNPAAVIGAVASVLLAVVEAIGPGPLTLSVVIPAVAGAVVRFFVTPEPKAKDREWEAYQAGIYGRL